MRNIRVKKSLSYLAIAVLIVSIVASTAGCKKTAVTSTDSNVSTSMPSGPVTLNIYHWTAETNVDPAIAAFEKLYPNVTVKFNKMATSDQSISNVILASGTPVDAMAQGTLDDTRMRVENNTYVNLDPYLKAEGIDYTKLYGKDVASLETFNGKHYALPYSTNYELLLYNKAMFDKAGIPVPTDNWTWADLQADALKLTSGTGANKVYGFLPNYDDNAGTDWCLPAQEQLGANYLYNKDGTATNFDNPAFLSSLQLFYDMETKDKSAWPLSDYAALQIDSNPFIQFYQGKTAMLIAPEYAIKYSSQAAYKFAGFDYGAVNIPKVNASDPLKNLYYVTDYAIPVSSKNKAAAWEFIKFFCIDRPDLFAGGKGQLPGAQFSTLSTDMQKTITNDVFNFPHFDQASGERVLLTNKPTLISKETLITTAKTQINAFVKNEITNCLEGNETPAQALKNMKVNCDLLIKQAGK